MTARVRTPRPNPSGEKQDFLEDRIEMPAYDESIFYPEKVARDLGFTEEDINDLAQFMRWHINQRKRGVELKRLVNVLGAPRDQLFLRRKDDLLRELQSLEQLSI